MGVTLYQRSLTSKVSLETRLRFRVNRYSFHAKGGPDVCTITGFGDDDDLWQAAEWLRCPVEIFDERANRLWWGHVRRVTIRDRRLAFSVALNVYLMANSVAVKYSYVEPGTNTVGETKTTSALQDADSIAEYGTKELLQITGGMSTSGAEALRALLLAQRKLPVMEAPQLSGAEESASVLLECEGWWKTLYWRKASVAVTDDIYNHDTTGSANGAVGYDTTYERFAQAFTVGTVSLTTTGITARYKKVGTPADNVTVGIYADDGTGNAPTGSALASATFAAAGLTTSFVQTTHTLVSSLELRAGVKYWMVWTRSGANSTSNYVAVDVRDQGVGGADIYTGGKCGYYDSVAGTWTLLDQRYDAWFTVETTNTAQTSSQIEDLITNYGQFLSDAFVEEASGITESTYQDGHESALEVVERLMGQGVSSGRRYLSNVTPERLAHVFQEPASSNVEYLLRKDNRLVRPGGGIVDLASCPVGFWCALEDVIPPSVDFSLIANPQPFFVEWSEWDPQMGRWAYTTRDAPGIYEL